MASVTSSDRLDGAVVGSHPGSKLFGSLGVILIVSERKSGEIKVYAVPTSRIRSAEFQWIKDCAWRSNAPDQQKFYGPPLHPDVLEESRRKLAGSLESMEEFRDKMGDFTVDRAHLRIVRVTI